MFFNIQESQLTSFLFLLVRTYRLGAYMNKKLLYGNVAHLGVFIGSSPNISPLYKYLCNLGLRVTYPSDIKEKVHALKHRKVVQW